MTLNATNKQTEQRRHAGGGRTADLAISEVGDILPFQAQPQAQDQVADLIVLVQAGVIFLLHIQDLATERQDSLKAPIPGLFCTATCTNIVKSVKAVQPP